MSQPTGPGMRSLNLRGAVDLSALTSRAPAGAPAAGGATGAGAGAGAATGAQFVIAVNEANFATEVMERSTQVPVVIDFWADWCQPCKTLSPILEKLAAEFGGQLLVATIDVDANQQLAGAFGVQSIPSVFAVVGGRPLPLFQGAQPEAQVRAIFEELLKAAAANGVTGRVAPAGPAEDQGELGEEPMDDLPAAHQAAYDAIENDDLPGAIAAFEQALREDPQDEQARLGLAQVTLMQRTAGVDLAAARAAAAADPLNLEAAQQVADLDVLGGHVEDAFSRLIELIAALSGDQRNTVRTRLVELFDVVGSTDPRVIKARSALANALF